tara:strand:- start:10 stop:747 length:738 start_codon:yes stop_codon:yes gene_type:complete
MSDLTFYDKTPFNYGYSKEEDIISNMNPLLKNLIEENSGKIFYDIGCGCGRNLIYSSKYAKKIIGVDISSKSLEFASQNIRKKNVEFKLDSNLNLSIDSNIADVVISDGVCHHTGDTFKAFSECLRILKPGGFLYLAVYKKYRYYPFIYYTIGFFLRTINKYRLGNYVIENIFVPFHYLLYKIFKKQKLLLVETKNIFYDYFITPVATFQSKKNVISWCRITNSNIKKYLRTTGNCHTFIIKKND